MDGGAWKASVYAVAEGRIQLNVFPFTFHFSLFTFLHCWGISLVCLALELVGSWVELDFNVGMEPFGEGGVTPLQYSCLENPMDRGAWWAAVHGVAKSRR